MIDALVSGTLMEAPITRTKALEGGRVSDKFVTCRVRCTMDDGEAVLVSAIAFDDTVKTALAALDAGDPVSLAGSLNVGTYEARDGSVKLSINPTVSAVLTAYHVQRKRQAARGSGAPSKPDAKGYASRPPLPLPYANR